MPSSESEYTYKLSSPYELVIVQNNNGSYHLYGHYTPFGLVTTGMGVVDAISNLETDNSNWPLDNVRFNIELIK